MRCAQTFSLEDRSSFLCKSTKRNSETWSEVHIVRTTSHYRVWLRLLCLQRKALKMLLEAPLFALFLLSCTFWPVMPSRLSCSLKCSLKCSLHFKLCIKLRVLEHPVGFKKAVMTSLKSHGTQPYIISMLRAVLRPFNCTCKKRSAVARVMSN